MFFFCSGKCSTPTHPHNPTPIWNEMTESRTAYLFNGTKFSTSDVSSSRWREDFVIRMHYIVLEPTTSLPHLRCNYIKGKVKVEKKKKEGRKCSWEVFMKNCIFWVFCFGKSIFWVTHGSHVLTYKSEGSDINGSAYEGYNSYVWEK